MISTLEAPVYVERVALCDSKHILQARKAVRKALELQKQGAGFTMIEILSPCPTILKMEPTAARRWVAEVLCQQFPPGVYRDRKPEFVPVAVPQKGVAELLEIGKGGNKEQAEEQHAKAETGMREHMEVSWLPSYGPEMRSGSAYCDVTLSHERIGTPLVSQPEVLVAMNEPSLRKFGAQVKAGGVLLYNGRCLPEDLMFEGITVACVPATEIADQIGAAKVGNVVMMGALLEASDCLPFSTARQVLSGLVKYPKLVEMNELALEAGRSYLNSEAMAGAVAGPDGCGE